MYTGISQVEAVKAFFVRAALVTTIVLVVAASTPSAFARGHSGGGSVHVSGYTRSNGTYVHSYYRSAPGSSSGKPSYGGGWSTGYSSNTNSDQSSDEPSESDSLPAPTRHSLSAFEHGNLYRQFQLDSVYSSPGYRVYIDHGKHYVIGLQLDNSDMITRMRIFTQSENPSLLETCGLNLFLTDLAFDDRSSLDDEIAASKVNTAIQKLAKAPVTIHDCILRKQFDLSHRHLGFDLCLLEARPWDLSVIPEDGGASNYLLKMVAAKLQKKIDQPDLQNTISQLKTTIAAKDSSISQLNQKLKDENRALAESENALERTKQQRDTALKELSEMTERVPVQRAIEQPRNGTTLADQSSQVIFSNAILLDDSQAEVFDPGSPQDKLVSDMQLKHLIDAARRLRRVSREFDLPTKFSVRFTINSNGDPENILTEPNSRSDEQGEQVRNLILRAAPFLPLGIGHPSSMCVEIRTEAQAIHYRCVTSTI